jgi:hypothetical protein
MYRPERNRFEQDSVLKGGGGVEPKAGDEPCVGTGSRSGVGNWVDDDYCWRRGRWVHVRQLQQERLGNLSGPRYVLTTRKPRGGRMVTVSVDTSANAAAADPRGADQ